MATFTNQATLSYGNVVKNSNVVTGELLEVLSATKTAVGDSFGAGDVVTYIVSVVNSGPAAYNTLTVTDNLGAYALGAGTVNPLSYVDGSLIYYVNGVQQPTPTVTAGDSLTVTGIDVPAGGNATLVYKADVTSAAPLGVGGTIVNTATVNGDILTAPITVDATIAAAEEADLTVSKAICPPTVVENGQITYTFVIQNSGNTAAAADAGVVISDVFDPILRNISVSLDSTALTAADYTYDTATGSFATNAGRITVPAATYTQDATTGIYTITPGVAVLTVTGTV